MNKQHFALQMASSMACSTIFVVSWLHVSLVSAFHLPFNFPKKKRKRIGANRIVLPIVSWSKWISNKHQRNDNALSHLERVMCVIFHINSQTIFEAILFGFHFLLFTAFRLNDNPLHVEPVARGWGETVMAKTNTNYMPLNEWRHTFRWRWKDGENEVQRMLSNAVAMWSGMVIVEQRHITEQCHNIRQHTWFTNVENWINFGNIAQNGIAPYMAAATSIFFALLHTLALTTTSKFNQKLHIVWPFFIPRIPFHVK